MFKCVFIAEENKDILFATAFHTAVAPKVQNQGFYIYIYVRLLKTVNLP